MLRLGKVWKMSDKRTVIENKTFDEERALYALHSAEVKKCIFAGPADGESALKECRDIAVRECSFSLRYPLWHARNYCITDCCMDELTRAPIWYSRNGRLVSSEIRGIKCLRECDTVSMENCLVVSPEFGWKCKNVDIKNCNITSEYFLFESKDITIDRLVMKGKYSFQYVSDAVIENSELDTKDAFWHSKNVTVRNSVVKGEYLGWYSENLTLEKCRITGTQPLCYCKNLKLIECTMENTDLSFEYSEVDADIIGHIDSVKNPRSGRIVADEYGEIILENSVMNSDCLIENRKNV